MGVPVSPLPWLGPHLILLTSCPISKPPPYPVPDSTDDVAPLWAETLKTKINNRTEPMIESNNRISLGVVMVELLLGAVATVGMVNRVRMSLLTQSRALADGAIDWTGNTAEKLADIAHG